MHAKRYTVNLDTPASKRWLPIIEHHKEEIKKVIKRICSNFP